MSAARMALNRRSRDSSAISIKSVGLARDSQIVVSHPIRLCADQLRELFAHVGARPGCVNARPYSAVSIFTAVVISFHAAISEPSHALASAREWFGTMLKCCLPNASTTVGACSACVVAAKMESMASLGVADGAKRACHAIVRTRGYRAWFMVGGGGYPASRW